MLGRDVKNDVKAQHTYLLIVNLKAGLVTILRGLTHSCDRAFFFLRKVVHCYVAIAVGKLSSVSKWRSAVLPCGLALVNFLLHLGNLMCAKLRTNKLLLLLSRLSGAHLIIQI